jgi:hypothetical protein
VLDRDGRLPVEAQAFVARTNKVRH